MMEKLIFSVDLGSNKGVWIFSGVQTPGQFHLDRSLFYVQTRLLRIDLHAEADGAFLLR